MSKSNFYGSMGLMSNSKTIYQGVGCAKMFIFWDITRFYGFVGLSQFLEVKYKLLPNRVFMVVMGWIAHSKTNLRTGVLWKKMSNYWDISIFYGFVVLDQFLEVRSRPLPYRNFMLSMGWMTHSETIIIIAAQCKKKLFY